MSIDVPPSRWLERNIQAQLYTPQTLENKQQKNQYEEVRKRNALKFLRSLKTQDEKLKYLGNEMEKVGVKPFEALQNFEENAPRSLLDTSSPILRLLAAWDFAKPAKDCATDQFIERCKRGRPFEGNCGIFCKTECSEWLGPVLSNPPIGEEVIYSVKLVKDAVEKQYHGKIQYIRIVGDEINLDRVTRHQWMWNDEKKVYVNESNGKTRNGNQMSELLCHNLARTSINMGVQFDTEVPYGYVEGVQWVHTPIILYRNSDEYYYWLGGTGTSESETWMAADSSQLRKTLGNNWLNFEQKLWWLTG